MFTQSRTSLTRRQTLGALTVPFFALNPKKYLHQEGISDEEMAEIIAALPTESPVSLISKIGQNYLYNSEYPRPRSSKRCYTSSGTVVSENYFENDEFKYANTVDLAEYCVVFIQNIATLRSTDPDKSSLYFRLNSRWIKQ